jgi:tetratricopeptide (TPR) repeat protein
MRRLVLILLLGCAGLWAQSSSNPASSSSSTSPASSNSQTPGADSSGTPARPAPDTSPRSDTIPAAALEEGMSSSKDTQVDLSPPADDAKAHPQGAEAVGDAEATDAARSVGGGDVSEFHPWNPHKAAKDVEVGDFYFKRKNYVAAEDRYREALYYKENDATATFRLAVCLEKLNRPDEARDEYEGYLKILPYGPEAHAAQKAIDRLKATPVEARPAK